MSVLTPLQDMGVTVILSDAGNLRIQGKASQLDQFQIDSAVEYARNHKPAIVAVLSQDGTPGQCESCPAAGYWDHSLYAGQGLICFHRAYFLHKSGKPEPCAVVRRKCPRVDELNQNFAATPSRRQ